MSATLGGRTGRVFSLQNHALIEPFEEAPAVAASATPALPPIESALEGFIVAARQLESTLTQERIQNRQLRSEWSAQKKALEGELQRERAAHAKSREALAAAQSQAERLKAEYRKRLQIMNEREEAARVSVSRAASATRESEMAQGQRLAQLQSQVEQLRSELHRAQLARVEERKKAEIEIELARATIEHLKQREESLRSQSRFSEVDAAELEKLRREIHHYRSRWADAQNAVRQATSATQELEKERTKAEALRERLEIEEKRREDAENSAKKERRDKQIALNCLHSAEERIDRLTHDVQKVRDAADERMLNDPSALHLGF